LKAAPAIRLARGHGHARIDVAVLLLVIVDMVVKPFA
jgi:hypothetical protein